MVNFEVFIDEDAQGFLDGLPEKIQTNVRSKLRLLEEDPFPGGNKELLNPKQKGLYRIHISRTYTAFLSYISRRENCENIMARSNWSST